MEQENEVIDEDIQNEEIQNEDISEVNVEVENEAKLFGWVPKDEFRGNPDDWRDAETFVKRGKEINGYLRKDLEKIKADRERLAREVSEMKQVVKEFAEYHKETEKKAYERAMSELKQAKKNAIAEGDGDAVIDIEDKMEALKQVEVAPTRQNQSEAQPDPTWASWNSENQWFGTKEDLTAFANGYSEILRKKNPSLIGREFLDAVTEKVKEKFPEEFGNPSRNRPSAVGASNGGSRGSSGSKKSYHDLPSDAKAACDRFVNQGLMTRDEYVKEYDWS